MSQVKIQGNASGTGVFTIAAPNSNTDRTLTLPDNTGTVVTNASPGTVLQVVSTTLTTAFSASVTANNYTAVTGLTASITPTRSSSKILVLITMTVGSDTNYWNSRITRDGSSISGALATGNSNRAAGTGSVWPPQTYGTYPFVVSYLDSPGTTSSVTYGIQIGNNANSATLCVNRSQEDTDSSGRTRGTSTITVMEIAA